MIDELIERAEKGEGADRELDDQIAVFVSPWLTALPRTDIGGWLHPELGRVAPPEHFTTSLDAVEALIKGKLPGWGGDIDIGSMPFDGGLYGARLFPPDDPTGENFGVNWAAEATSPARALLAAFLRAHKEQHDASR